MTQIITRNPSNLVLHKNKAGVAEPLGFIDRLRAIKSGAPVPTNPELGWFLEEANRTKLPREFRGIFENCRLGDRSVSPLLSSRTLLIKEAEGRGFGETVTDQFSGAETPIPIKYRGRIDHGLGVCV